MSDRFAHALPFGAKLDGDVTRFRLWAPSMQQVAVEVDGADSPMAAEPGGWFSVTLPCRAGARYRFRLPDGLAVPDPASRAQDGDVHDPSIVVDPRAYAWQTPGWMGRPWHEAVIYELHPGAFGGFDGIRAQLPRLAALGVTALELMPVADFPGQRNWGYDGVLPFAPDASYGTPESLKALVDAAHAHGLMVLLDVVYNHFGPDGAYIHVLAKDFFRSDLQTPWGAAIDFRRPEVRTFFEQNALYWLMEYRFDGLRFDAVHAIGAPDFLDEMAATLRAAAEPGRHIHLVLEHEGNVAHHLRRAPDAPGYDAQWTDDVHHCLHVLLTHEREGYYEDFQEPIQRLARCMAEGFAYQGEISPHSGQPRGEPSGYLPTTAFVICLQNHDQIGNRAFGDRLTALAPPQALRAATALLLLAPFIPLLFMGEEFASRTPFLFFTDHNADLAPMVRDGRRQEFKRFATFRDPAQRDRIPDPNAPDTFAASVPDFAGDDAFHRTLLAVRHARIVPGIPGCRSTGVEVLSEAALLARWRLGTGQVLAIATNLGTAPAALPSPAGAALFATPENAWEAAERGALPPWSTIAWIEAAA